MALIQPSSQPARWLIPSIAQDGQTLLAQLTITNPTFDAEIIHAEGDTAFLEAGQGVEYTALPAVGNWLEAGEIYEWDGGLVIVRQSHTRTIYDPADTPALFLVYRPDAGDFPEWIAGEQVHIGDLRIYDDQTYRCLQAHVTQEDWTPPAVPALWELVQDDPDEIWAAGVTYVGDNTAGAGNGDVVLYEPNQHYYRCLQSHTSIASWTPPVVPALWLDIGT